MRCLQLLCLSLSLFLTLTPAPIIRAFVVTRASRITRIISISGPSFNHSCRVSVAVEGNTFQVLGIWAWTTLRAILPTTITLWVRKRALGKQPDPGGEQ